MRRSRSVAGVNRSQRKAAWLPAAATVASAITAAAGTIVAASISSGSHDPAAPAPSSSIHTTAALSSTNANVTLRVEAADRLPGIGWALNLYGRIINAPPDQALWLVSALQPKPPKVPRQLYYARQKIEPTGDGSFVVYDLNTSAGK